MNILLINPWYKDIYPPPSIGYLQSSIRGYFKDEVNVVACNIDLVEHHLFNKKFDLVGVSFHSFSVKYAQHIRDKVSSDIKLICGGHHPSALPKQLLDIGYNQVVIGEGENSIIDIILGNDSKIVKLHNNYFNSIDDIPFPNYSGLGDNWSSGFPIISSRGCPFTCNFCASADFWNRKWKMREVDNVIDEILYNKKKYNMNTWMFEDDNFTLNKNRAKNICLEIIRNNINLSWQCASRAETLCDSELCELLVKSGCKTVWLGVESLSQNSLDRCKKNTTVDKMLSGIEVAHSCGLETMSQFIVGLPGDTIKDILETSKNIKKSKINRMGCNIAWVLPNTEIYNLAKKMGFNDDIYLSAGAPYYTYEQSINTLNNWTNILNNSK